MIDAAANANIVITAPLGGANYENGTTLWLSKNHAGGHNIIDGTGLNTFNGLPGPYVFGGGAWNRATLVFYNGNWWSHTF